MFLTDGRVEVDTNTVERSMRPIALGRKNSLFSGSEGGGESWAILASLLNTAKLTGSIRRLISAMCSSGSCQAAPRTLNSTNC
jgi:hypothetical protein